jgi:hypothetical protein
MNFKQLFKIFYILISVILAALLCFNIAFVVYSKIKFGKVLNFSVFDGMPDRAYFDCLSNVWVTSIILVCLNIILWFLNFAIERNGSRKAYLFNLWNAFSLLLTILFLRFDIFGILKWLDD